MLDVGSKAMSAILNARAQRLLEKNGRPAQFEATPKVGCAEAAFSSKTTLQSRRETGVDSRAMLIDLVKARGSAKRAIASTALRKMGAPEKHIK